MRNPVTVRRMATAAVAPLLLAGLVACGPSDDKSASGDPTAASPSTTESTGSSPDASQPPAGKEIDAQDFVDKLGKSFANATTAQITMKISSTGLTMSATGEVDYTRDSPAMALKMTAAELGEGTIDMRLVDKVMYMSMPMLDPSGKFFKIDLNDPNNALGDSMGSISSFDPQSTIEMLSKGVKSVKVIGPESVDGDDTTRYQVTAATKDLAKSLGGATGGVDLPKEFTYDIWLDGDNQIRKMTTDVDKQATVEMQMSNWGEPVDIAPPPSSEVQEMPDS